MKRKGIPELVTTAFLWGTIGIATQLGIETKANPYEIVMFRTITTTLISLLLVKDWKKLLQTQMILMGIIAIAFYETYIYTVSIIGASLSAIFLYTAPFWLILFSKITKDKINLIKIISAILTFSGIYIMYLSNVTGLGFLLGLSSGLIYAILIIQSRIMQNNGYRDIEILIAQSIWSMPFSLFAIVYQFTLSSILAGVYLGIFPTFLAYMLFYRGMRSTDSIIATIITSLEPVFTIILAIPLLHQYLTFLQLVGAIIIIFSSILVVISK